MHRRFHDKYFDKICAERKYYVYVLYRPWDGTPCYVGKGSGRRWLRHHKQGANHTNPKLAAIFKKAKRLKLVVEKKKRYRGLTEPEAFELEKMLIAKFGRIASSGCLANQTDGGGGMSGYTLSAKSRERIKALWATPEFRKKQKQARTGLRRAPGTGAKISAAKIAAYKDPMLRARTSAAIKAAWQDPAYRAKRPPCNLVNDWCNPVYREKQCAAQRAGWARRRARLEGQSA